MNKVRKISFRISEDDWNIIHQKAERARMSLTEYITTCCLGKKIVIIDGLDDMLKEQRAIGRNLNQLTMLSNMGRIDSPDLKGMTDQYRAVSSSLKEMLKRKRWSDGDS